MADLFALSDKIIREGVAREPINRINYQLSELTEQIAMVESFSHAVLFRTGEGLVVFDTSGAAGGGKVVGAIRQWSKDPFHTLVYTHGHVDHVGGSGAFLADCQDRGRPSPRVIGHENIGKRFDRYDLTNGYNMTINRRQFGRKLEDRGMGIGGQERFLPADVLRPDLEYQDHLVQNIGGLEFQLHHARGETDDHTWAWIPEYKTICAGDFFIWNFPNAGNPQKVQRYPLEWAAAMRSMAARNAEYFLPAHGLPIRGREQIRRVLTDVAESLEDLVRDTLGLMNEGVPLGDVIHEVRVPAGQLAKPWLTPLYDEPEFVVRNIWRMYGGWYDGNPARLKPARDADLAAELAALAGGAARLADRARVLADEGQYRLACHLVEMAARAAPEDITVHGIRRDVYRERRKTEFSLMAKGIFNAAAQDSEDRIDQIKGD